MLTLAPRKPSRDLPERTREHINNDIGRRKFRALFSDPLFMVREETDNDYGVDICIEALTNDGASPTNIRAQVQLKSSAKKPNVDGSYSCSIARSNLNYLLNSHGAFYAFYSVPSDAFYYRSADDVSREYEESSTDWKKQKHLTVNFSVVLDKMIVEIIHDQLLEDANLFRELRLQLTRRGFLPGARFVYGELYFEESEQALKEYLEANNVGLVYTTDDHGNILFLHNLVWEMAHGPIPTGYQVYHVNGNTLDNRRANLDIVKTTTIFPIEEFQVEVETAQIHNIVALITEGPQAELNDVPPPPVRLFEQVVKSLEGNGWRASNQEMTQIKSLLTEKLSMKVP